MKTDAEIRTEIQRLEGELERLDEEFEEALEDEDIDEFSDKGEALQAEFDVKKEIIEKQIKTLKWNLE